MFKKNLTSPEYTEALPVQNTIFVVYFGYNERTTHTMYHMCQNKCKSKFGKSFMIVYATKPTATAYIATYNSSRYSTFI